MTTNRLFAKYGHDCTIPSPVEDLYMFRPTTNILTQIRNIMVRWKMASELNYRSLTFFKSQKVLEEEHRRHIKNIYIIHPFSELRKWWEVFMIFIFLIQFILIPIELSVYKVTMQHDLTETQAWHNSRFICDCICMFDVFLTFFTGYCDYENNVVVLEPKRIAVHYSLTYFVPDFLSSLPLNVGRIEAEISENFNAADVLIYVLILKIIRFSTLLRYSKQFAHTYAINQSSYKLFMLLITYFLFSHLATCMSIFVFTRKLLHEGDDLDPGAERSLNFDLVYALKNTYIFMYYQTTLLITNVGYMNVATGKYQIYSIVLWLLAAALRLFMMAVAVDAFLAKTSAMQQYFAMETELRSYMQHKQLPVYLQKRILTYNEFRYEKSYFRESEILNCISGHLRQDVIMHTCSKLVENVQFFENLPTALLVRIVSVMKLEIFMTNDVVLKANTRADCMYFISCGAVAVFTKMGQEICHLRDGQHFGEVGLVMKDETRIASVIAVEMCELYKLEQSDFIKAIMPYPDLLQKIVCIAHARYEETRTMDTHTVK